VLSPWALFKAFLKCLDENHTFLIAFQAATFSGMRFFNITSSACTHWSIAQYCLPKLLHWSRVEPLSNGHGGNVVVCASVEFVIFLAADTQAAIPIDV
jgi:hypothetical protein